MSLYTMCPVIDINELKCAIEIQYDIDIYNLRDLLFFGDYANDCYKLFYFGEEWEEDTEAIRLIKGYLKDILPDYDYVLIDVSW